MKAVIFDMDGVLVDNTSYHVKAWKRYLKKLGFNFSAQKIRNQFHGRTNEAIYKELYGKNISPAFIKLHAKNKEALYRKFYRGKVREVKGLRQFLKLLKERGIQMALATSAPAENIGFIIDHLKIRTYFQRILDPSQVKHGKPHPEIYLLAAKALELKPPECLVIEDTKFGVQAAKRAKMRVAGVLTTHTPKELGKANLYIKDFSAKYRNKILKLLK